MTAWDILRYLYFASCISMGWFIVTRADQFMMSYGMTKMEDEKENREPGLSFAATMVIYVILSPILWLVIFDQHNRKK